MKNKHGLFESRGHAKRRSPHGRQRSQPLTTRLRLEVLESRTMLSVTIAWSPVGNPGNTADPATGWLATGSLYGAVGYAYNIGTYDVTNSQYVEFLNTKDATGTSPLQLYNSGMSNATYGGINYNAGNANGNKYSVMSGDGNHPVNYVTWYDTLRFANWLNNGQGNGNTESGAYTLLGGTPTPSNGDSITRNAGATVFLPSENEWHKAAYYNPATSSYFTYPTSSNTPPTASVPTGAINSANFYPGGPNNLTDVGAYSGTTSPYGAFDMGGDVWQWNEALPNGSYRDFWGGSFGINSLSFQSPNGGSGDSSGEFDDVGFRVAKRGDTSSQYTPIGFSYNSRLQDWLPEFGGGNVTLGGVPFNIPSAGNNVWQSVDPYSTGPNPRTLTIPVNVFGVDQVNTLINSWWGESVPGTEASIKFSGSAGASYTYNLDGGSDTRDYFAGGFANTINGSTTINVFDTGTKRIDMQTFMLPQSFWTQTLTSIQLADNGSGWLGSYSPVEQREYLAGLTVHTAPVAPPVVTLTSPSSGIFHVGDTVHVTGTASSSVGIDHVWVQLYKGGTDNGANFVGNIYTGANGSGNLSSVDWHVDATLNGQPINGGDYLIKWVAFDTLGQAAGAYSSQFLSLLPPITPGHLNETWSNLSPGNGQPVFNGNTFSTPSGNAWTLQSSPAGPGLNVSLTPGGIRLREPSAPSGLQVITLSNTVGPLFQNVVEQTTVTLSSDPVQFSNQFTGLIARADISGLSGYVLVISPNNPFLAGAALVRLDHGVPHVPPFLASIAIPSLAPGHTYGLRLVVSGSDIVGFVYDGSLTGPTLAVLRASDTTYATAGAIGLAGAGQISVDASYGALTADALGTAVPAVNGLSATATGPQSITLRWKPTITDGKFFLERASSPGGVFQQIAILDRGVTSFPDPGPPLTPGTAYSYRLWAMTNNIPSAYSSVVTATTLAAPPVFVSGPRITTPNDLGPLPAPVDHLDVTFDKPINDASFTASDVVLKQGTTTIAVQQPFHPDVTNLLLWRIPFAPQSTPGPYTLTIGPQINDPAGKLMNQNGNQINGDSIADQYRATLTVVAAPPTPANPQRVVLLSASDFQFARGAMDQESGNKTVSGLTVITHGFTNNHTATSDAHDSYLLSLGTTIQNTYGGWVIIYHEAYNGVPEQMTVSYKAGPNPNFNQAVLLYDWKDESNALSAGWTEAAGDALFATLVGLHFVDPGAGKKNSLPIHFIGHSFGAAVTSEVVQRLDAYNVPVDQVTYLDPHDFNQDELVDGAQDQLVLGQPDNYGATTWKNVGFTDVYYQQIVLPIINPIGRPIPGAFNLDISSFVAPFLDPPFVEKPHNAVWNEYYKNSISSPEGFLATTGGGYAFSAASSGGVGNRPVPQFQFGALYTPSTLSLHGQPIADGTNFKAQAPRDIASLNAIYNGTFSFSAYDLAVPGWSYHGGNYGGNGELELVPDPTDATKQDAVLSTTHPSLEHNWMYIPAQAFSISFTAIASGVPSPGEAVNVMLGETPIGQVAVNSLSTLQPMTMTIPAGLIDHIDTLTFELVNGTGASVSIGNISFSAARSRSGATPVQAATHVASGAVRAVVVPAVDVASTVDNATVVPSPRNSASAGVVLAASIVTMTTPPQSNPSTTMSPLSYASVTPMTNQGAGNKSQTSQSQPSEGTFSIISSSAVTRPSSSKIAGAVRARNGVAAIHDQIFSKLSDLDWFETAAVMVDVALSK